MNKIVTMDAYEYERILAHLERIKIQLLTMRKTKKRDEIELLLKQLYDRLTARDLY